MPTPNRANIPRARKERRIMADSMWCFICSSVGVLLCFVNDFLLIQRIFFKVALGDLCRLAVHFHCLLHQSVVVLLIVHE